MDHGWVEYESRRTLFGCSSPCFGKLIERDVDNGKVVEKDIEEHFLSYIALGWEMKAKRGQAFRAGEGSVVLHCKVDVECF